jgi:hypothetical protein
MFFRTRFTANDRELMTTSFGELRIAVASLTQKIKEQSSQIDRLTRNISEQTVQLTQAKKALDILADQSPTGPSNGFLASLSVESARAAIGEVVDNSLARANKRLAEFAAEAATKTARSL